MRMPIWCRERRPFPIPYVQAPYAVMAAISQRVARAVAAEEARARATAPPIKPRPPYPMSREDRERIDAEWERAEASIDAREAAEVAGGSW